MELAEDELSKFVMVWISAIISLSYCYALSITTKVGFLRFFLTLPVITLFFFLPLNLTSVHLSGITAFFLSWLANFKILLFSFGCGPLCTSDHSSISLLKFIALACLPIKVKSQQTTNHHIPLFNYLIKGALLALMIKLYDFRDKINPKILWIIYFFHLYFMLELILAIVAAIVKLFFGIQLESQFNEPLISSSLQDFWGKRWNLMVTRILRPTVYIPVLDLSTSFVGRQRAAIPAVLATFFVSGAMHELIFYYIGRMRPTFEVSAFFMLHGVCVCLEIVAKRELGGLWKPPKVVSGVATIAFVLVTGFWLFLPPMLKFKVEDRAFEEYRVAGVFVRNVTEAISLTLNYPR